jgi:hypothetical protein
MLPNGLKVIRTWQMRADALDLVFGVYGEI